MEADLTMDGSPIRAAAGAGPLVKICGVTRAEDAALAARLGAWAVGLVFAESPRRVKPAQARILAAAARMAAAPGTPEPVIVGVFVDEPAEAIAALAVEVELDAVQLHGARPGAEAVRTVLAERLPDLLMIQAVAVPADGAGPAALRAAAAETARGAGMLLFDTRSGGRFGGTGIPFPWALAREAADGTPFLVAGGLGPGNAAEALRVSGAVGIDVSSGVESSPGIKDAALLRALFGSLVRKEEAR